MEFIIMHADEVLVSHSGLALGPFFSSRRCMSDYPMEAHGFGARPTLLGGVWRTVMASSLSECRKGPGPRSTTLVSDLELARSVDSW